MATIKLTKKKRPDDQWTEPDEKLGLDALYRSNGFAIAGGVAKWDSCKLPVDDTEKDVILYEAHHQISARPPLSKNDVVYYKQGKSQKKFFYVAPGPSTNSHYLSKKKV